MTITTELPKGYTLETFIKTSLGTRATGRGKVKLPRRGWKPENNSAWLCRVEVEKEKVRILAPVVGPLDGNIHLHSRHDARSGRYETGSYAAHHIFCSEEQELEIAKICGGGAVEEILAAQERATVLNSADDGWEYQAEWGKIKRRHPGEDSFQWRPYNAPD